MPRDLQLFARLLMEQVRDRAIQSCDMNLREDVENPVAKRWRERGVTRVDVAIPDIVDETIFAILNAVDQNKLRLLFVGGNGEPFDLAEEGMGELGGWFMGTGGWRAMYSHERFVDDFADEASKEVENSDEDGG